MKEYIGSDEHFQDEVQARYYQQEQHDKEQQLEIKRCSSCGLFATTGFERNLCPFFERSMFIFSENTCNHFKSRKKNQ